MTAYAVIENTYSNQYVSAYNCCIGLGVDRVIEIFDSNIEENLNFLNIRRVVSGQVSPEALLDLEVIIDKLKCSKDLTRQEQVVLGMVYLECKHLNVISSLKNKSSLIRQIALKPRGPLDGVRSGEALPRVMARKAPPRSGLCQMS